MIGCGARWGRACDVSQEPTKFLLVMTAKALSLTIPLSLLLRADQVIQ
jgi:hypothetical protein